MATILIIEDEELARLSMCEVLTAEGHRVIEAKDGVEGMTLQRSRPADLVVTDIFMPRKDGVETIVELRKAFPGLPIIAVSGGGSMKNLDYLQFAEKFGACRVLIKPVVAEDLVEAVSSCLGSGGQGGRNR